VYRLLERHRWRKVAPDTRHPKAESAVQEEWAEPIRQAPRATLGSSRGVCVFTRRFVGTGCWRVPLPAAT
jgi:hypothetical protein